MGAIGIVERGRTRQFFVAVAAGAIVVAVIADRGAELSSEGSRAGPHVVRQRQRGVIAVVALILVQLLAVLQLLQLVLLLLLEEH